MRRKTLQYEDIIDGNTNSGLQNKDAEGENSFLCTHESCLEQAIGQLAFGVPSLWGTLVRGIYKISIFHGENLTLGRVEICLVFGKIGQGGNKIPHCLGK